MQNKLYTLSFLILAPAVLYTSGSFALTPDMKELPLVKRVCVFDVDETLVFDEAPKSERYYQAPQAQAVIDKCIANNYGVAIATKKYKYRSLKLLADLNFGEYNPFLIETAAIGKSYTDVRDTHANPIYIFQTNGNLNTQEPKIANKAQSMDRIMRSYFGIGVGGSFVDYDNKYLKKYAESHEKNTLPSDKDLTGCLVLFDDQADNTTDIKLYNTVYGVNFGAVQVDKDVPVEEAKGVSLQNADEAFKYMDEHCKS